MERKNYFELLGLAFDLPEANEKKFSSLFKSALAEWKKRTEDLVNNPNDDEQKAFYSAELAYHDDIIAVMGDKKLRNAEARSLKEKRIAQLEQLLDIMLVGQSGIPEVTNAQIRSVHVKLGLSPKTVEETYQKKGFHIQLKTSPINLNDVFLGTVVFNRLLEYIERFRSLNEPKYPWSGKVHDLYELACYFTGGDDAETVGFSRKRTTELYSIMESGAAQLASDMSIPGHLLADMFHAGCTQVFDSEVNRKKYDQSLERAKLREFFSLLRTAPECFKKDNFFAEGCITKIQRNFPDYNLALALYNQEVGLGKDPYEPIEAFIHVSCAVCKAPAKFRTREEAVLARCSACGAELYVKCPQCGKSVPASADRCSCGFLISEMQFFDEYVKEAQIALQEMDLAEAKKQLTNAKNAYPEHPKLAVLEKQIQEESSRYQKPLDELRTLISADMYEQAQKVLVETSKKMPRLRLEAQRKLITDKLDVARRMMPPLNMQPTEAANQCVEILRIVKDYKPAIDRLSILPPPSSPKNLRSSVKDVPKLTCILTWGSAGDSGVTYSVVRKKNGIPKQHADGESLASELGALEYKDTGLQPGVSYGYAVFACRYGVYSEPATCEVVNYSELDPSQIQAIADDRVCRFSWVLPVNCMGVRILRSANSLPGETPGKDCTVIVKDATSNFSDTTVSNDTRYGYRLQCIYRCGSNIKYSPGQTVMLTPEEPPFTLRQTSLKVENKTVFIKWSTAKTTNQTVIIREASSNAENMIGRVMPASDINSMLGQGKIFANVDSSKGQCQFDIPLNTSINIAFVVLTSTRGVVSCVHNASSVPKCEINRLESRIEGGRLKIVLQSLPKYLERIHYIAATKTGTHVPWASAEDARRNALTAITASEYIQDGMILVEPVPKADLYISVIGQYRMPDGNDVFSEASRIRVCNKPKSKIEYQLTWDTTGLFFSKARPTGCKLIIHCNASETPEMKLVCRTDGHIPMRLIDPKTVVLHIIPEQHCGFTGGKYIYELSDATWTSLRPHSEVRLMISENDMAEYELICMDIANSKIP